MSLEEVTEKLKAVTTQAETAFARPGATKKPKSGAKCGLPIDSRLIDFIYEVVFSSMAAVPQAGDGMSLDEARGIIFTLPDFKAAVDRVAYSEDLLTRAVSLLEGMVRCRLCGSNNTSLSVRQMHSSDEAPTMMLYCGSCHHRTNQTGE